jgi:hypothetical protein
MEFGFWPLQAWELTGDNATERGEHGLSVSGLTGLGRWCGDPMTAEMLQQRRNSAVAMLDLGGTGKLRVRGVVKVGRGISLL